MQATTWFVAGVACIGLVGCAHFKRDGEGHMRSSMECDGSGPCRIAISPSCSFGTCGGSVDNEYVVLKRGKHNIQIFWKLPQGYSFCPNLGDGVFLKRMDPDDQFNEMFAADDESGKPSVGRSCSQKQWHWTGRNTISKPQDPYPYKIIFHGDDGRTYTIDPFVVNG